MEVELCIGWRMRLLAGRGLGSALSLPSRAAFNHLDRRNTKRNITEKMMETEEEGPVKDLDLSLPGREALGLGLCDLRS